MSLKLTACLVLIACHHNPNAPVVKNAAGTTCGVNAHRSGNDCACDDGYAGDGISCSACDMHATAMGLTCSCNAGYHGDGTHCESD